MGRSFLSARAGVEHPLWFEAARSSSSQFSLLCCDFLHDARCLCHALFCFPTVLILPLRLPRASAWVKDPQLLSSLPAVERTTMSNRCFRGAWHSLSSSVPRALLPTFLVKVMWAMVLRALVTLQMGYCSALSGGQPQKGCLQASAGPGCSGSISCMGGGGSQLDHVTLLLRQLQRALGHHSKC